MKNSSYANITNSLKKSIKAKGITYRELAKRMEVSESGLKKTLSGSDCSVLKLAKICQAIDLPMYDLFRVAEDNQEELKLTKKQEEFFLKNQNYFDFFWELCGENKSIKEVQKAYRLTDNSIEKYLLRLDRIGLIEYKSDKKYKIAYSGPICWSGKTELAQKTLARYQQKHLDTLQKKNSATDKSIAISLVNSAMSKKLYSEYIQALLDVNEEYIKKAHREKIIRKKADTIHLGSLIAVGPVQYSEIASIPNI